MKTQVLLLAGALLVLASGNGHAAEGGSGPHPTEFPGRSIDILGISPGMTPAAVNAILEKVYPTGKIVAVRSSIQLSRRGVTVRSPEYIGRYHVESYHDINETLDVVFSGPASGNGVVAVQRRINYPSPLLAPEYRGFHDQVLAKYGRPSRDSMVGQSYFWTWAFAHDRQVPCGQLHCQPANDGEYEPADLSRYATYNYPDQFVLEANLMPSIADGEKLGMVSIGFHSFGSRAVAARTDLDTLIRQADAQVAKAKPAAAPKL